MYGSIAQRNDPGKAFSARISVRETDECMVDPDPPDASQRTERVPLSDAGMTDFDFLAGSSTSTGTPSFFRRMVTLLLVIKSQCGGPPPALVKASCITYSWTAL
ncbi:hypothetical protein FS837_004299 [Tulasnella sp. UAMH 9824]|nr:hypothetical protein FS837_004299 [Tulasnella sp. UAMH 9824]